GQHGATDEDGGQSTEGGGSVAHDSTVRLIDNDCQNHEATESVIVGEHLRASAAFPRLPVDSSGECRTDMRE
ncbi:hypothetical protein ACFWWU_37415, partial [Streptomyces sp. NPDC058650]|uniref:hypothetical protein n=1 Tax=Streptomyces sp. NPDC058650 TaxID=3346575 RepID=UPI003651C956